MTDDSTSVDLGFAALADPVRRAIIARLSRGPATVNEIAEPFEISLQAVSKHIQVLEHAGLVTRTREAQRRPVHLNPDALERLTAWIDGYRLTHEQQFRRLDAVLGAPSAATQHRSGAIMSNSLHLDVPAGVPWIDFTREFDAPVAAVFDAHRDPEKVKQWLGPNGYEMDIDAVGLHHRRGLPLHPPHATHGDFGFRGVFHIVRDNEFALQTFEFDGAPDVVALESMWFDDLGDGRTRLRGRSIGRTVEGRDAMVESGMEVGMAQGYERLEAARRAGGVSAVDWTLEVVVVPVSDLARVDRLLPRPGRLRPRPRHQQRVHARRAADPARVGLLDRHRRPAVAERDGAGLAARAAARGRRRRGRARASWSAGASSAARSRSSTSATAARSSASADPDGNTWAVQQLRGRADKPLIPLRGPRPLRRRASRCEPRRGRGPGQPMIRPGRPASPSAARSRSWSRSRTSSGV